MTNNLDLDDGHYSQLAADLQSEVRRETYGEDLGQAGWLTLDELRAGTVRAYGNIEVLPWRPSR
jgi:hypothetical protein